ncbi:MAG: prepilin-type N-terminal cleavage/methylation domain-containing protein [Pseudomonadota bacterium]
MTGIQRTLPDRFPKSAASVRAPHRCAGFQLIELMLALAILMIVMAIAVPGYGKYRERVDTANAIVGINTLVHKIELFVADNLRFPDDLDEIGMAGFTDPWGNPFVYTRILGAGPGVNGKVRKDKSLHPLNTDYDLLSIGKNGLTSKQIITPKAQDDIIRANNGRYVGLARDY